MGGRETCPRIDALNAWRASPHKGCGPPAELVTPVPYSLTCQVLPQLWQTNVVLPFLPSIAPPTAPKGPSNTPPMAALPSERDYLLLATASKSRLPHSGHVIFLPMMAFLR